MKRFLFVVEAFYGDEPIAVCGAYPRERDAVKECERCNENKSSFEHPYRVTRYSHE